MDPLQLPDREDVIASSNTKETGLRNHHKKDMSMNEILSLLRPKVLRGHQLPTNLKDPPWRISNNSTIKKDGIDIESHKINCILQKSWEAQSSTIPQCDGHGDFSDFIVSNSSLAVSGLLKTYFDTLDISNVSLVFGLTLWDKSSQGEVEDYDGTPHVWLDIAGNDIDNSYVDVPSSGHVTIDFVYNLRQLNTYVKEDPWKTKHRLYIGQEAQHVSQTVHNLKIFREYHKKDNIEKYLVFSLHHVDLNPTVKMYDILMRHFLETEFNAKPEDLVTKWQLRCWCCGTEKPKEELKSCTTCKMAVYCNKICQAEEWKIHKLLHKELEITKEVLSKLELEESLKSTITLHTI